MNAQASSGQPVDIRLTIEGEGVAPGQAVSFSVSVTANQRISGVALVAELVGVEELDIYGDEEDLDEEEMEDGEVDASLNGTDLDDDEDEFDEDEEEDEIANETYSEELVLTSDLTMQAGETRTFDGSFTLPEDAQPTYNGVQAWHTWWLDAFIEMNTGDEIGDSQEVFVR
ncbi:MAG: hypothetical protein U0641_11045 [Anaerolineae bacterium]